MGIERTRAVDRRLTSPPRAEADGPVLETPRLRLRPFRASDLDAWARITADPLVMRSVGGRPLDRDGAWRSLGYIQGHWRIRGFGLWAAEAHEDGALVGRIGLYRPEGWPGLEVGWLIDRAHQGRGLATEGGAAAMGWGFEMLGARRLVSVIEPENAASVRVAEKLGERFVRRLPLRGRTVCLYAIDRERWREMRGDEAR